MPSFWWAIIELIWPKYLSKLALAILPSFSISSSPCISDNDVRNAWTANASDQGMAFSGDAVKHFKTVKKVSKSSSRGRVVDSIPVLHAFSTWETALSINESVCPNTIVGVLRLSSHSKAKLFKSLGCPFAIFSISAPKHCSRWMVLTIEWSRRPIFLNETSHVLFTEWYPSNDNSSIRSDSILDLKSHAKIYWLKEATSNFHFEQNNAVMGSMRLLSSSGERNLDSITSPMSATESWDAKNESRSDTIGST